VVFTQKFTVDITTFAYEIITIRFTKQNYSCCYLLMYVISPDSKLVFQACINFKTGLNL
jgi:hypothetical protein